MTTSQTNYCNSSEASYSIANLPLLEQKPGRTLGKDMAGTDVLALTHGIQLAQAVTRTQDEPEKLAIVLCMLMGRTYLKGQV